MGVRCGLAAAVVVVGVGADVREVVFAWDVGGCPSLVGVRCVLQGDL